MMRLRWYTRIGSTLLAILFVVCVTEPVAAMHRCPMHDGVAGVMVMPNGHSMDAASTPPPGTDSNPSTPAHHNCTCVGDCAGAVFAGLPAGAVSLAGATVRTPQRTAPAAPVVDPVHAPHALPFANGPPATA